jgi:hypothetical protein
MTFEDKPSKRNSFVSLGQRDADESNPTRLEWSPHVPVL